MSAYAIVNLKEEVEDSLGERAPGTEGRFARKHLDSEHLARGATVEEGQTVLHAAEIDLGERARATAEAAYKRGAKFVDVAFFDPFLKRVRIESASPAPLDFVPQWYGERVLELAEQNG